MFETLQVASTTNTLSQKQVKYSHIRLVGRVLCVPKVNTFLSISDLTSDDNLCKELGPRLTSTEFLS